MCPESVVSTWTIGAVLVIWSVKRGWVGDRDGGDNIVDLYNRKNWQIASRILRLQELKFHVHGIPGQQKKNQHTLPEAHGRMKNTLLECTWADEAHNQPLATVQQSFGWFFPSKRLRNSREQQASCGLPLHSMKLQLDGTLSRKPSCIHGLDEADTVVRCA